MANLLDLNSLVNAYCPNVPSIVVSSALRECARDYFSQVSAYKKEINLSVLDGQASYLLEVDPELEIVSIESARYDQYDVLVSVLEFPKVERSGKPYSFTTNGKREIILFPTPDSNHTITVTVSVRPAISATSLDDSIYTENQEGLRYGTLLRLKSQPQTDWFSPNEVAHYDNKYQSAIAQRRIQLNKKDTFTDKRIEFPFFA